MNTLSEARPIPPLPPTLTDAGWGLRLIHSFLDVMLFLSCFWGLAAAVPAYGILIPLGPLLSWPLHCLTGFLGEWLWGGRTPGKYITGCRVTNSTGGRASGKQLFLRMLAKFFAPFSLGMTLVLHSGRVVMPVMEKKRPFSPAAVNPGNPFDDLLPLTTNILQEAEQEKRFWNWLVDGGCYAAMVIGVCRLIPEYDNGLILILFIWVGYGLFLGMQEYLFKGQTLGKMLTRTRVVAWDGTPATMPQLIRRSVVRMFLFEWLSALQGSIPHDDASRTKVVQLV